MVAACPTTESRRKCTVVAKSTPFRALLTRASHSIADSFVDRYMPGYYLFLDTIRENEQWKGRSKTVTIDLDRTSVAVEDW